MSIINTALIGKLRKTKASKTNVLELDQAVAFTPSLQYHPATKEYVDEQSAIANGSITAVKLAASINNEISANTAKISNVDHPLVETAVPVGAVFTDTETTTSLSHNVASKILSYVDEVGTTTNIDLTQYIDDTNLARLTSGSLAGSGIATFTRDDSTTFTIDMSSLLDTDTNTWRNITDSVSTTDSTISASATAVKAAYDRVWPNTTYTATQMLDAVKTVDGSGSGLDADLLDGQQGSYYSNTSHTHNYVPHQDGVRYTTDFNTILASGFYNAQATPTNSPGGSYGQLIVARGVDTGMQIYGGYNTGELWFRGWASSGATMYSWNKVWHNNNDGSGSGLDADLLDGIQASGFATNTLSNVTTIPAGVVAQLKGDDGADGADGAQGNIGNTGSQGIQGNIGNTGNTGNDGAQGIQGIQGTIGPSGSPWGGGTFTGDVSMGGFNINSIGTATATLFAGVATSAQWADLAEKYEADAEYGEGVVLGIGGDKEVTKYTKGMPLAGVVSAKPAFMMNNTEETKDWPFIALKGRVPVNIKGTAKKGDYIIAYDGGKGIAVNRILTNSTRDVIIGIALSSGDGVVEVKI
jgi:hypothetical protein